MTVTASTTNEAQTLSDLPDIQEHPEYAPAWQRLQELRLQLTKVNEQLAKRSHNESDGQRSKLDVEAEQLRTGRKPRSAKPEATYDELQHQRRVLRRAIEQQEREVHQAEHAACSQLAHEVQQQELSHAKRIANYMKALRSALLDRQQLHEELRTKGYEGVFTKISWVQFRHVSDSPNETDLFSNWLQQAAAEYGKEVGAH